MWHRQFHQCHVRLTPEEKGQKTLRHLKWLSFIPRPDLSAVLHRMRPVPDTCQGHAVWQTHQLVSGLLAWDVLGPQWRPAAWRCPCPVRCSGSRRWLPRAALKALALTRSLARSAGVWGVTLRQVSATSSGHILYWFSPPLSPETAPEYVFCAKLCCGLWVCASLLHGERIKDWLPVPFTEPSRRVWLSLLPGCGSSWWQLRLAVPQGLRAAHTLGSSHSVCSHCLELWGPLLHSFERSGQRVRLCKKWA